MLKRIQHLGTPFSLVENGIDTLSSLETLRDTLYRASQETGPYAPPT
jgi:hypothetical protein